MKANEIINQSSVITIVSNHYGYYRAKVSIFVRNGEHNFNCTSMLEDVTGHKVAKGKDYVIAKFCLVSNTYAEDFATMIRKELGFTGIINCCEISF